MGVRGHAGGRGRRGGRALRIFLTALLLDLILLLGLGLLAFPGAQAAGSGLLLGVRVESSTGSLTDLDGTAFLTFTLRVTNTNPTPLSGVRVTETLTEGLWVTGVFGGDSRSAPPFGSPRPVTWTLASLPAGGSAVLTFTAHLSDARAGAILEFVGRATALSGTAVVAAAPVTRSVGVKGLSLGKVGGPSVLRVGDRVRYALVFTVPPGVEGMGTPGSRLSDLLPLGIWFVPGSATLTWTPAFVPVMTSSQEVLNTSSRQVVRWFFEGVGFTIHSPYTAPTVVTLTYEAQVVGERVDTGAAVYDPARAETVVNDALLYQGTTLFGLSEVAHTVVQPFLGLAKAAVPPAGSVVGAGQTVTYTLTVANDGYGPAYDLELTDRLGPDLTLERVQVGPLVPVTAPVGVVTGVQGVTVSVGELAAGPGTTFVVTVVARVAPTVGVGVDLTNRAWLTGTSYPGTGPGPFAPTERIYTAGPVSTTHTTVVPDLSKGILGGRTRFTLGEVVTYLLAVPATPVTATLSNPAVTDLLDGRLLLWAVDPGPSGSAVTAGNAFTVTYPQIPVGEQRWITVTARLEAARGAVAGDRIANSAVLRIGSLTLRSPTATFTVTEPALTVAKESAPPAGSTVGAGAWVTYTLRITAAAGLTRSTAYDLTLTDTLPVGMRATAPQLVEVRRDGVPVTATSSYDGGTGRFLVTPSVSLDPGSVLVVRYRARVDADVAPAQVLANGARVGWTSLAGPAPGERRYEGGDAVALTSGLPALTLVKRASAASVNAGERLTYTLWITNGGIVSATGVVVTDRLPAGVNLAGATPAPAAGPDPFGVLTWTLGTLNVGEGRLLVLAVDVDPSLAAGTVLTNGAWASTAPAVSASASATVTVGTRADLGVGKGASAGTAVAGQDRITYTVWVTNAGPSDAVGVVVTDTLPAGVSLVGATPGYVGPNPLVWSVGTLAAGASRAFTVVVAVSPSATGVLTNVAQVGSGTADPNPANNRAEATTAVQAVADLGVGKAASAGTAVAGQDRITYTVWVTNAGPSDAVGVVVTDTLPAGVSLVGATPGYAGPNPLVWSVGSLPVGASRAFTVVVAVDPAATGVLTNVAQVGSGAADPNPADNRAEAATAVQAVADLGVTKGAPATAAAGTRITYTVWVTNAGPSDAVGVVVTDTLPAGVSLVGATPGYVGPNPLVWSVGSLPVGASRAFTVVVAVDPAATGVLTNVAQVGSGAADPNPANNRAEAATAVQAVADLGVTKGAPATAAAGTRITYTVWVTNAGPSDAVGVVVTDTLPAGVSLVGATPGYVGPNPLVWDLGALTAGASRAFTVVVSVDPAATGVLTNVAQVGSGTVDPNPADNRAEAATAVQAVADLGVGKAASAGTAVAGQDRITYTVWVTNAGPSDAVGVVVTDTLPAGVSLVGATPGYAGPNPLVWSVGSLPVGASRAFTVVVAVSPSATGVLTNVAQVGSGAADPNPANNRAEAATAVQAVADLGVGKAASAGTAVAGQDRITYTVWVTNAGPSDAVGVVVTDTLPAGVTFVGASAGYGGPNPLVWNVGTLPVGASSVLTVVVAVDPAATGVLTNVVEVRSGAADPNPANNRAEAATAVQAVADLGVTKGAPATAAAGTRITYTVWVTNAGPSDADAVVVTDTLPAGVSLVGATPGYVGPNPLVWDLGALAAGASRAFTVVVAVDPAATGVLTNVVEVRSGTADPNPADNRATATTAVQAVADLRVAKAVSGAAVPPGATVTYTVWVTNAGPSNADAVVVTDTLPAGVSLVGATPGYVGPNPLVWDLGALTAGASRAFTVVVAVDPAATGVLTNVAQVGSGTVDPNLADNRATAAFSVLQPALTLRKAFDPARAVPGMPVTVTLWVTNSGQVPFTDGTVTDTLPAGLNYVAGSASLTPTVSGSTLVWSLGALDPGQWLALRFVVTPSQGLSATVTNRVEGAAFYATGKVTAAAQAALSVEPPRLQVSIRIVGQDLDLVAPNYVTFSIQITNAGPSPFVVVPLDQVYDPNLLSFVSGQPAPDDPTDDGRISWFDLTGPVVAAQGGTTPQAGFGRDLGPGEAFQLRTVFLIRQSITSTQTTAEVVGAVDAYGNGASPAQATVPVQNVPTAVDLLYFRALPLGMGQVRLEWATAAEVDTLGFRLLRAPTPDRSQAREVAFVVARGQGGGATYAYVDAVPEAGVWWYWLTAVDTAGGERLAAQTSAAVGTATGQVLFLPVLFR